MHPTQLPAHVIDRIVFRLHGFESIEPHKTALLVIDMQNVFCAKGAVGEVATAREIVPNINRLARATRAAGGSVVWVQMIIARWQDWALVLDNLLSPAEAERTFAQIQPGRDGHALWPRMEQHLDARRLRRSRSRRSAAPTDRGARASAGTFPHQLHLVRSRG
jgi:ureidoacrylate peracid hydrolase